MNKKVKFAGLITLAATFLFGAGALAFNFFGTGAQEPIVAEAATASEIATSWTNFIKGTGASWTLPDNWTAPQTNYVGSFGTDVAAFKDGALYIPEGRTVTINLNGKTLNRNCAQVNTYGGCVIYNEGNLTINDAAANAGKITGGNNSQSGGGIYNAGTLTLNGGQITGNTAINGGGVFSATAKIVRLAGTTISNNHATEGGGGGLYVQGEFTMSKGTVSNNDTVAHGGGICFTGTKITVTGGTVTANTASSDKSCGGGLYITASSANSIKNLTVTNNTAGYGGGLSIGATGGVVGGVQATITGGTYTGNTASVMGGGLRIYGADSTINGNIKVDGNQARYGGGISFEPGGKTPNNTISAATITNNRMYAANNTVCAGAGIYANTGGTLNINAGTTISGNKTADGNTATNDGGGMFITGNTNVNLNGGTSDTSSVTIENNDSMRNGGGAFITGSGTFTMTGNVYFNWNTSQSFGGAIWTDSYTNISGGKFYRNGLVKDTKTIRCGQAGAIYFGSRTGVVRTITKCTFDGNAASGYGGAILSNTGTLNVGTVGGNNADVVFRDNYSKNWGGAINCWRGAVNINSGTFEYNSAVSNGGALYLHNGMVVTIKGGLFQNNGYVVSGTSYAVINNTKDGGAICASYSAGEGASTLNVLGGTFTGNRATNGGGAIQSIGNLNISGGTISNNQSTYGSAVYGTNGVGSTKVTISGGTISGNTATGHATSGGGAVYAEHKTTLTISGGKIQNNTTTLASAPLDKSTGVVAYGTLNMSGAPVITGNKRGTAAANLYSSSAINIIGVLTTSLNVGTVNKGVLTKGYNSVGKMTSATLFKTDLTGYKVAYQSQEIVIVTSGTDATKVLVTPTAGSGLTYNGSRQVILSGYIAGDMTIKSVTLKRFTTDAQATLGTSVMTLNNTTNALGYSISGNTITATEAGQYTIIVSAAGGKTSWVKPDGTTATGDQTLNVTIAKKTLIWDPGYNEYTYNGASRLTALSDKAPSVTTGQFSNVLSGWTYTYYKNSVASGNLVADPSKDATFGKNTGHYYCTYTPVYKGDAGYNYYTASGSRRLTIIKAPFANLVVTVDNANNIVYDGNAKKPNFTISYGGVTMYTYNGSTGAITTNNASTHGSLTFTVAYSDNTEPGTANIEIVITNSTNFYTGTREVAFTIKPMTASADTISGTPNVTLTKTYDGTTTATVSVGSLSISVPNVTLEGVSGSYDTPNVGTDKTITVTLILGGSAAKYWDAKVTVSGGKITAKTLSSTTATVAAVTGSPFTYTGSAQTPKPAVTDTARKTTLEEGTDYTISYSANVNVGTATITFTGKGNYTGNTLKQTFKINAKNIATDGTVANMSAITYDGAAHNLTPAVTNSAKNHNQSSTTLTNNTDYTLSYSNSNGGAGNTTNAGTVTVTVTGKGNYTGKMTKDFVINPKSIAGATVTLASGDLTYNGSAQPKTATVTVVLKSGAAATTLTEGAAKDYTLSYSNSNGGAGNTTNAGTVTVTVTGNGNYTGTATSKPTYVIAKAEINKLTFDKTSFIYNNQVQAPKASAYETATAVSGKPTAAQMFTVSAGKTDASATAYSVNVTINAAYAGNYKYAASVTNASSRTSDTVITREYTIAKVKIDSFTWDNTTLTYNGSAQAPTISAFDTEATVANMPNAATLFTIKGQQTDAKDGDYTAYAEINSAYAGNYEFAQSLQFNGNAQQTGTTYKINPAQIIKIDALKELATPYTGTFDGKDHDSLKEQNAAMKVPTGNTMTWYFKTTAEGTTWTTDMPYYKDAGTYQVYYKITATNHADVEGSVTVTIDKKSLADAIIGDIAAETFNGAEHKPTPVVTIQLVAAPAAAETLTAGTHFTYSYSDNVNKGTAATVTITAAENSNYTGSTSKTFTINAKKIDDSTVTVDDIAAETYDGKAHTPETVIKDSESGKTLVKDTDYTLSYSDNTAAGNATITITGIGNYDGTTTKTFTIDAKGLAGARVNGGNALASEVYTGSAIAPDTYSIEVDLGEGNYATLVKDTDFTLSYENNTSVGTATIKFTGKGNYSGEATATFEITNATIVASVNDSELTWTYDGKTHTVGLGSAVAAKLSREAGEAVNILIGYTVKGSNAVALQLAKGDTEPADWSAVTDSTLDFVNVADGGKVWYRLTADNHDALVGSFDIEIDKKEITAISGVAFTDKTYDGNTDTTLNKENPGTPVFTGIIEGDTLTVDAATAIAFDNKNAGENKTVTATGITLAGESADNYTIKAETQATGTATINKLKIEIEWHVDNFETEEGLSVNYDRTQSHKAVAKIKNLIEGDPDTLEVVFDDESITTETVTNIGRYPVKVDRILGDSGNYTLEGVVCDGTLSINSLGIAIYRDVDSEKNYVYDGKEKLPALYYEEDSKRVYITDKTVFATYFVNGTKDAAAVDAGDYTVIITLDPNYDWAGDLNGTFNFSIGKATLGGIGIAAEGAEAADTTYTYEYDGNAHSLTADWSSATINGKTLAEVLGKQEMPEGVSVSYFYDGAVASGKTNANESGYAVEIRFTVNGNFEEIPSLRATLKITRKAIVLDGVTFEGVGTGWINLSIEYDGTLKTVVANNLPAEISAVAYEYFKDGASVGTDGVREVGSYSAVATLTYDATNYKLVKNNAEVSNLSCDVTVSAKSVDLDGVTYTGATDDSGVAYDGETHKVAAGNLPDGVTGVSYEYFEGSNSKGTDGVKDAGSYKVVVTFTLSDNYGGGTETREVKLIINKAVLIVKVNGAVISYGEDAKNDGVTISGLLGSDTAAILNLTYKYTDKTSGNSYAKGDDAGEYDLTVTCGELKNYTLSVIPAVMTVNPREITVAWRNGESDTNTSFEYVYSEGTVWAPYAYVTNAYGTDALTLVVDGGKEDAAMNCTATVVGISGDKAHNYKLPTVEAKQTFNVLPSPRTGRIVWEEAEFVYNGQAQTPKAYYFEHDTDRVPKELAVTTNVTAINAGHYTATASLGSNYDLQGEKTYEFDIVARKVYIEILSTSVRYSANIDYSALNWTYVDGSQEFVSGDVCNVTLNADSVNGIGKYKIAGSFSTNNAANYEVTFVGDHVDGDGGVLTVTRGVYDMTNVAYAGTEVTYDGKPHAITVTGLPEGVTATLTYSKDGVNYEVSAEKNEVIGAGKYDVEIKYSGDFVNYEALTATTVTLNIKKAALTVKANNSEITYGDEPKANGVTYSGFVNGEDEHTAGVISGTLLYTYNYNRFGAIGTYSVKATEGCLTADNYDIVYTAGTLTVKPRELTVEWYADAEKTSTTLKYVYNGLAQHPVAIIAGGVVNNDYVTVSVEGAQTEIGENYTATAVTDNANYVVAASCKEAKFGIIPAEKYTLVWDHTPIVYNGAAQQPKAYYYDGDGERQEIASGDITLSGASVNAGNYTATVSNLTVGDGHVLNGSFEYEILPASVTVTITGEKTVKYGTNATFTAADWTVTEGTVYNSDDLKITLKTTADENSNIGTYLITATYTNGNYTVTFVDGALTVEKADVSGSVEFDNVDKTYTYDGTQRSAKIVTLPEGITGVRYEYTDKAGSVVSTEGVKNCGEYTVTAIFTVDGNHNAVESVTTKITITEKALTGITLTGGTFKYNGGAHVPALEGDGLTAVTDVVYAYEKSGKTESAAVNAGVYKVTVTLTIDKNYDASGLADANAVYDPNAKTLTLTTTLEIEKAELTVTAKDGVAVYGAGAEAGNYGYTIRGFVNGENEAKITVKNITYNYQNGVNSATTVAGRYEGYITVTLDIESENYVIGASEAGTYTVTPKTITVEWIAGADGTVEDGKFVYKFDNNEHAPVAVAKDEKGNDIAGITLTVSGKQSALGENYTARVTGIEGTGHENYALPLEEATAHFIIVSDKQEERNGKVIWDNTEHEYDGKAYKPTAYFYVDDVRHDIDPSLITVEGGNGIDADSYTAKVPAEIDGVKFDGDSLSISFVIKKRTVYVVIGDATVHYGTAVNLGAVSRDVKEGSAQFLEEYTIDVTCTADATSPIGKYKLAGRFISTNASNYNVIFCGSWASPDAEENGRFGTLTVERAIYDMTKVTFMDTEVTYDGQLHKVTLNGLPAGLTEANYECSYTSTQGFGGNADGVKNAGTYNVTVKFKNLDSNYEAVSDMHATLNVKKAALKVTANYSEVIYGDEPQTAGVSYEGFVTGETESVLNGELKYSYTYTRGASVGEYVIKVSGLTSNNYDITFLAGTMNVIPRTVTVSWYYDETLGTQPLSYKWDGNKHKPVAIAGGLVSGDVATITVSGETDEIGANFTATASAISNTNYKLPTDGSESVKFSVLPINEKYIMWDNSELVYNGSVQKPHAYYVDQNGDEVSLDEYLEFTLNNGISAGDHSVAIPTQVYIDMGLNGDRSFNYAIAKAKLTVTVNDSTMKFGGEVNLNGYEVTGTVYNSDNLNVVLATEATGASSVGKYEITATYSNENYDITFVNGTLTIGKADVNVSGIAFDNADAEYEYTGDVRTAQIKMPLPDGVTGVRYEYLDGANKVVSTDGVANVGSYTVKAIFTVDGNHNEIADCTTTINITKAKVDIGNVKFDSEKSVAYNGDKQEVFVSGTATGVSGVTYTYYEYDENAADGRGTLLTEAPVNAGSYVVVAAFSALDNYDASNVELTMLLTVTKAQLTVTVNDKTLVYGEAADANGYGYVVQGLLGRDKNQESVVLNGLTLDYADAQHADAGTYDIIAKWNGTAAETFDTQNYTVTVNKGTLTVTQRVITADEVVWTGGENNTLVFVYDGTEKVPTATANGLTLTVSGGATEAGKYTATVTGVSDDNYKVAENITHVFEIVAQMPEIVWTDTQFVYDGNAHVPTATLADGSAISETVTVVEGSAVNKGTYTAEVEYNGTKYTTSFEILARKVYIVIDEVTTTYKTAPVFTGAARYMYTDPDKQFVSENIEDMIRYYTTVPVTAPVGTYAGLVTARYTGSANYEVTVTDGTLRVLKAQYDMSGVKLRSYVVNYDGLPHAAEIVGCPEGVTAEISYYTSTIGWSYDEKGVVAADVYSVRVTFTSSDDNYEPIPDKTGVMEIRKITLTVTANDSTITYGEEPVANGVEYAGWVNGENVDVLGGTLGYSFNYNKNGAAGTYSVTPEGLTSDNYDIKFVSGKLTVERRVVTVEWYKDSQLTGAALQYTYDGVTEFKPYAVAGNVVAGDSVTLTVSGGQRVAGLQYLATVSRISNNNYALPDDGSASVYFDVLPRAYEIVWENTEFVYDPLKRQAPGAYIFDANGEKLALTVTILGGKYNVDAGIYTAMVTAAPNGISLSEIKGEIAKVFEIKQKEITIKINSVNATYGKLSAFDTTNWEYVGENRITDGNFITLKCDVTTATTPDAGVYAITGECSSSNYNVTFINGTYTIERAEISVPVLASKAYTGSRITADVPESAMYEVLNNYGGINVGSYVVRLYLRSNYTKNYKWTDTEEYYVDLEFRITKAENSWTVPFEMDWVLNADANTLNANVPESAFGTPVVKFYDEHNAEISESELLANKAAGKTYTVKVTVEDTANYSGLTFEKSIVIVGDRSLALAWDSFDATYNGTVQKPKAYVTIAGEKVYLKVNVTADGAAAEAKNAGTYTATVEFVAEDGRSLAGYKLYEGAPSADKSVTFKILARKITVLIEEDRESVYGERLANITNIGYSIKEDDGIIGGDRLGITFVCHELNGELTPAGKYAILGSWTNKNYEITFEGSWNEDGSYKGAAATYTVIPADISIRKTGSEWIDGVDQEDEIDYNTAAFITLDERTEDDSEYKNIVLKGDKSARVTITYSNRAYVYDKDQTMTDEDIARYIVEGQTTAPEIVQAGDFAVYYRIEEPNHNVKYGQWIVRIRIKTEFIIVTFKKAFTVPYGETITGKNLMPELIKADGTSDYLEMGDGMPITLAELRKIAKAYAYEDVSSEDGVVNEHTDSSKYVIRFVFNDNIAEKYDHIEFKYSGSNAPNSDTNTDKYEVTRRQLAVEWKGGNYVYDGLDHLPEAKLTGLVGGQELPLDLAIGTKAYTLDNGDVINVTVALASGSTSAAGTYGLSILIDNNNYLLTEGMVNTVTIARRDLEIVWGSADFTFDGASHIPTATLKNGTEEIEITFTEEDIANGYKDVTLANGDVIRLKITLNGDDTVTGNYSLAVEIDGNANYALKSGLQTNVTIVDKSKVSLPNWAIYTIVAAAVVAGVVILSTTLMLKKRNKQRKAAEGRIDEDGFNEDYNG